MIFLVRLNNQNGVFMKLYVMRHGMAASADIDPKRGLTQNGSHDIAMMARRLQNCDNSITQIIHSGILRAQETAEIMAKVLNVPKVIASPELLAEHGSIDAIVALSKTWRENTLLVGHLPMLFQLINKILINQVDHEPIVDFQPGSIVCLDHFAPQRFMIEWFISPDVMR